MSIASLVGKAASESVKKSKEKKNTTTTYNKDERWEEGNLEDIKGALKEGAKWDKEHSKSGWTNPQTGDKFSAKHYEDNYKNDIKALQRVKDEQNKRKLAKGIRNRAENVKSYKLRKRDKIDDYIES